jgi:hypothetical protein
MWFNLSSESRFWYWSSFKALLSLLMRYVGFAEPAICGMIEGGVVLYKYT